MWNVAIEADVIHELCQQAMLGNGRQDDVAERGTCVSMSSDLSCSQKKLLEQHSPAITNAPMHWGPSPLGPFGRSAFRVPCPGKGMIMNEVFSRPSDWVSATALYIKS